MKRIEPRFRMAVVFLAATALALADAPIATDAAVLPTITAISAGYGHTCALTVSGGVKCWGQNGSGQLGNGTTTSSNAPVDVSGLASGISAIAAGGYHVCALTSQGGVRCWGKNSVGGLGNGSTANSSVPVDVVGLASGVTAIAAGEYHACAVTSGGRVKCWGANHTREPDQLSTTYSSVPVDVSGLASGVSAIAAAGRHTCVRMIGGKVKCWGYNWTGQLGNGTTTDSLVTPVDVAGFASRVSAIEAGYYHTCALTSGGGVKCWGYNVSGQLGDRTTTSGNVPVDVAGVASGISAIAAGISHTCVLSSGGGVKCWGSDGYGQLGNSTTTDSLAPVDVSGLGSGVSAISAGYIHTCALSNGGRVKCWGDNSHGQLGNGTRTGSDVPVDVDLTAYQAITLRASRRGGTIAQGTAVTFSAVARPLGPAGEPAKVRFEFYRQDGGGIWRLAARRDVVADTTGRATLRWTFATSGPRYVRARALANETYAASPWSARIQYSVD